MKMPREEKGKHYVYTIEFDDYREAIRCLRKLRKRNVELLAVVIIVRTDHWNRVKDFLPRRLKEFLVIRVH